MTPSPDPEEYTELDVVQAQHRAADLVHELHHCETREDAIRIFREKTLGDDLLLTAFLANSIAHIETISAIFGHPALCDYMEHVKIHGSAQWN